MKTSRPRVPSDPARRGEQPRAHPGAAHAAPDDGDQVGRKERHHGGGEGELRATRHHQAHGTPESAQDQFGDGDREFFEELARAGGGQFNDLRGALIESVLLSVLEE